MTTSLPCSSNWVDEPPTANLESMTYPLNVFFQSGKMRFGACIIADFRLSNNGHICHFNFAIPNLFSTVQAKEL